MLFVCIFCICLFPVCLHSCMMIRDTEVTNLVNHLNQTWRINQNRTWGKHHITSSHPTRSSRSQQSRRDTDTFLPSCSVAVVVTRWSVSNDHTGLWETHKSLWQCIVGEQGQGSNWKTAEAKDQLTTVIHWECGQKLTFVMSKRH